MKRKEFISKVEKLGFRVTEVVDCLLVKKYGLPILEVFDDVPYSLLTAKVEFDNLTEADRKQLFTLATEYAATPLEEREEEKRYGIVKFLGDGNKFFLKRWSTDGKSSFNITGRIIWTTTSLEKAQALATLVGGEVEEV